MPLTDKTTKIALTSLSTSAGCAAKIAQVDLIAALQHLPVRHDPRLLVGVETSDDAAVIALTDDLALIETVDIFTPIVDDPYDFGRIAAANALSDVYAMGGRPLSALSFVAWPMAEVGPEALGQVFRGAQTVCDQVGIVVAGGHSIVDKEPKFGLFVTGLIHPDRIVANDGARPGDVLVLTKAIGTGVLTTARKRGFLDDAGLAEAVTSMTTLNNRAAEAMIEVGVRAATDVTGFGLLGHLGNVLRASSGKFGQPLGAQIDFAAIPLMHRVAELAERGLCPAGSQRNLDFAAPHTRFADHLAPHQRLLLADAQTSGGLLMAVPPERVDALRQALFRRQVSHCAIVGQVVAASAAGVIDVT